MTRPSLPFCSHRIGRVALALALGLHGASALAQLSGVNDRFLIVDQNLLKGFPDGTFGAEGMAAGDLNCDGIDDLVVQQPRSGSGTAIVGGGLDIIPSAASVQGLRTEASFVLHQDTAGVPGVGEANDRFGASVAIGDLNGDGCKDLVVGIPREDIGSFVDAGNVLAFPGNAISVIDTSAIDGQFNAANSALRRSSAFFGSSIAIADAQAGAVQRVTWVGATGIAGIPPQTNVGKLYSFAAVTALIDTLQRDPPINDFVVLPADAERWGGEMLAFGNGPNQHLALVNGARTRLSLVSNAATTTPTKTTFGRPALQPSQTQSTSLETAPVAGDFDCDGTPSLALVFSGQEVFVVKPDIPGIVQQQRVVGPFAGGGNVMFAAAVSAAAGDFDADGCDDLALGYTGFNSLTSTRGAVVVLRGSPSGLRTDAPQTLMQGLDGLGDSAEEEEQFGSSLVVGDFNGDHVDDLAIGVPGEKVGTEVRGGVHLVFGHRDRIFANGFE